MRKRTPQKKVRKQDRSRTGYWSGNVTRNSNALDLEPGVFTFKDPARIALSLKCSAEASRRRKTSPFQSAMSMLNFYLNRAGRALPATQKRILQRAKPELRKAFGKPQAAKS